jgi:molybdate transport system ATP-binding protein
MLVAHVRDEMPVGITHVLLMGGKGIIAKEAVEKTLNRTSSRHDEEVGRPSASAPRLPPRQQVDTEPGSQALVHLADVSVSYNGIQVLQRINWTIRRGESWALLGPNGAGKTTLLSLILGDNPQAYANDITLFGKRRGSGESIWDIKRHIGWVAPELHLYYPESVSCLDVVCSGFVDSIGRHHRYSSQQRETALAWMQHLGILPHADTAFEEVSEGEQRMILIARAVVKRPALLVLDEPCQGLDADNRDRVLHAVKMVVNRRNTSMIYVTHHLDALPEFITHVLNLHEGRIVSKAKMDLRGSDRGTKDLDDELGWNRTKL